MAIPDFESIFSKPRQLVADCSDFLAVGILDSPLLVKETCDGFETPHLAVDVDRCLCLGFSKTEFRSFHSRI